MAEAIRIIGSRNLVVNSDVSSQPRCSKESIIVDRREEVFGELLDVFFQFLVGVMSCS